MTAVFITTTFDHYLLSSSEEAYRQLGENFTFICTKAMPESMLKLGFTDFSKERPYAINAFESEENKITNEHLEQIKIVQETVAGKKLHSLM